MGARGGSTDGARVVQRRMDELLMIVYQAKPKF